MADNNNIELGKFSFDVDEVVKSASELKRTIDALKKNQKELTKEGYESSAEFVQNAASLKALNSEYNKHIKVITESMESTAEQANREELLNVALNAEITTIKEARDNNKLLNKLRNETNTTTEEGRAQILLLNNQLDKNNELVKENADQYLKQKINIGNYQSALQGVSPQLATIIGQLESMRGALVASRTALSATTVGLNGTSKALKLFKVALISTGIGAIVIALGALTSYLTTTQAGIDAVTRVTRPLQAIFQSLLGVVQKLGESLFKMATNPKKALSDLVDFIKDNVMNRFKAFGVILEAIENRDFKGLRNGIAQAVTGIEDLEDKISNGAKQTAEFLKDAVDKGTEVDNLTKQIEKDQLAYNRQLEITNDLIDEQQLKAKDTSLDMKIREQAANEIIRLTKELGKQEEAIIEKKIRKLSIEQTYNDTSREGEQEMIDLEKELNAAQDKGLDAQITQLRVISQAKKEAAKEAEQQAKEATKKAIDRQKELLDLFITQQGTRAKTLEQEVFLEETLTEKRKSILKDELKSKLISQEKYNDEVLKLENELLSMRANLAVDNASRELEVYKRTLDEKLKANKFLSEEIAKQRQEDNKQLLRKQLEFAKLQLDQGLINQIEFDEKIRSSKEDTRIANEEIDKQREAIAKEEAKQLREIEFQQELERLEEERATKLEIAEAQAIENREIELNRINENREKGLISEELFREREAQIDRKYKRLALEREQILAEQKLLAISSAVGAVAEIVDKSSGAGKALAIAEALINTYQGISAGVKLGYPAAIPAVAAATKTGFAAVKNISKQELPSLNGGAVGGTGSNVQGLGADLSNILGKNINLNQIAASGNSSVQNQIENQALMSGLSDNVSKAVENGAKAGTMKGSEQGLTNLSDNKNIMQKSEF